MYHDPTIATQNIREPIEHLQHKRWLISITNACNLSCGNCAQLCGHFQPEKIWHMTLAQLDYTISILKRYTGPEKNWNEVTIFGGEPTIHPDWDKIPELLRSHDPMQFRVNTNGRMGQTPFQRDQNITYYVDKHPANQQFLMTMVAAKDYIPGEADNPVYFWELAKKDCPIWATEGAMIYNGKAYFCEHAAAMDHLWFDGVNGWEFKEGTNPFSRTETEIEEQAHKFCQHCGWCIREMRCQTVGEKTKCTQSNYDLFPRKQLLQLIIPPVVVKHDYYCIEKCLNKITHSNLSQLRNWEYVADLIRDMGLYGATEEVYGSEMKYGTGDHTGVWQEPTQSSKFLVWLSQQYVKTMLEVGSWNGCWALFMSCYLSRFGLEKAISIDIEDTVLPEVRRLGRKYALTFQQCGSDVYAGKMFDFVFLDGGRARDVVLSHWDNVGQHGNVVAFHDINCRFAPEIGKIWREQFKQRGVEYLHHDKGYGYDVFGIGVVTREW